MLAIESYAAPALGTNPTLLAYAISQRTHAKNIHCEYRLIGKLENLPTPCIANLFSLQYGGHFVAVLQVTPERVLVADPMLGRGEWTHHDFLSQWTGAAHVFSQR
jgi:ABC-type bacteriocin/lantibiotic exporter with double-glycine peptidase domain